MTAAPERSDDAPPSSLNAARLRAESTWLFVPLALIAVAGFIGIAFSPYLLVKAPMALIALSPLSRHLVVASPAIDPVPFFFIAVSRLFLPDPFLYALGRRYGPRALVWIEARSLSATRWIGWVERTFRRAGVVFVVLSPGFLVCTLAGVVRMPIGRFVLANLIGTTGLVLIVRVLGKALYEPIQILVEFFELHLTTVTAVSVGLTVVGWLVWRQRSRARLARAERTDGRLAR